MRGTRLALALGALLTLTGCGIASVDPGNRAVFATWGKVDPKCNPEGLYFYNPFSTAVYEVDAKIQKLTVLMWNVAEEKDKSVHSFGTAASKDLQDIYLNVLINFQLNGTQCHEVIRTIGPDFSARLIEPAVVESSKATVALFNAEEVIRERAKVKGLILDALKARLGPYHIDVTDVSLVNIDFTKDYARAIEDKQIQQQKVLQAEYIRQQKEKEAQQVVATAMGARDAAIAQAEGEARTIRLKGDATAYSNKQVKESLSSEFIRYQQIQTWDGKLPTYTGGGVIPFLNLDK